jgi:hypothetical protein
MPSLPTIRTVMVALMLIALPSLQAQATATNNAQHREANERINVEYKAEKAACASQAGNAKDICIREAKSKEKIALAEEKFAHSGSTKDRNKLAIVRAESAYDVARERCDDSAGNAKEVCVKEAKANRDKALADAKMGQEIRESKRDAAQDKRQADYGVATAKCEALSADAKANCLSAAKAKYGE